MKRELIPAILAEKASDARQKFTLCHGLVRWIQLDVMDSQFVKHKTWSSAAQFNAWNIDVSLELHLMVKRPLTIMKRWAATKQFKRAIWHIEANVDHGQILDWCLEHHIQGGLALSPETPLAAITPYLHHKAFARALILGVSPGWSGQKVQPNTYKKVRALRGLMPTLPIAFDGGIKKANIPVLAKHGVTSFCIASTIFHSPDPRQTIKELKGLIRNLP